MPLFLKIDDRLGALQPLRQALVVAQQPRVVGGQRIWRCGFGTARDRAQGLKGAGVALSPPVRERRRVKPLASHHRADAARRAARDVNLGQNAQLVPGLEGAPTREAQKFGRCRCWPRDDRRPTAFLSRRASCGKRLFMSQNGHNHRML